LKKNTFGREQHEWIVEDEIQSPSPPHTAMDQAQDQQAADESIPNKLS